MTQHFVYFSPTTPYAAQFTVDLGTSAIRLGDIPGWASAAEAGDVSANGVAIDDPDGTAGHSGDAILGLKTFYVEEDACAAVGADGVNGTRLWTGYIGDRRYRRGNQAPSTSLITGAARRIDIDLKDLNDLASFRIIDRKNTTLTGTLSKTSGNTTVTGSGTAFLTELRVGSTLSIPGGGATDVLYVSAIATDTSLTVVTAPTHSASGQTVKRIDGDRPAETDVQRVAWIKSGVPAYFPVTDDAGYFDQTGGVAMDACDYTGQTPADVMADCALASGKNWFVLYWEATGTDALWYGFSETSTLYTSLLTLSDDLADVNFTTCFPYMPDAELLRSPARTYAGIFEPYAKGNVYVERPTTAGVYAWRDGTAPTANVKTAAKATAVANRLLADAATEEDRITCKVQLPASLATGIKAGQRLQFRSTFMPGYSAWTWMRVARLSVAQDEETDQRYTLSLELTPQHIAGSFLIMVTTRQGNIATGGNVVDQDGTWTLDYWSGDFANPSQFPGPGSDDGVAMWHRAIVPGEGATVAHLKAPAAGYAAGWVFEVSGIDISTIRLATSGTDTINPALNGPTKVSAAASASSVLFAAAAHQKVNYGQVTQVTWTDGTQVLQRNRYNVDGTVGTCAVTSDDGPPYLWVGYATGSGTLTAGGTITCTGAGPDYNLMGRGYAALMFNLISSFSVVQWAHGFSSIPGGVFNVTLPSPP